MRYDVTTETENAVQDNERDYNLGMNNFKINCLGKDFGSTLVIDFYYDRIYDTSDWNYIKYNTTKGLYEEMNTSAYEYLTLSNGVIDVTVVRLTLTDGGVYDMDGVANGEIVDPSGPSVLSTVTYSTYDKLPTVPNTGYLSSGQNGRNYVILGLNLALGLVIVKRMKFSN